MKKLFVKSFAISLGLLTSLIVLAGLETGTYISDLVSTNPTSGDLASQGDDHIRLVKSTVKATFPNLTGAVTATQAELNILDGVTASTAELNIVDGVTSTAAELNILDGVTSTAAELNALDGITSTVTELNYTDGVTSAIQTQLNAKLASSSYTAADVLSKLVTVDGSGSGVDADLLDGNSSAAFASASHAHSAADVTSGTLAIARGGTGQTDGTARNITGKAGVTKTLSTSAASGGSDGDIHYRY